MSEAAISDDWESLSRWSIVHFAVKFLLQIFGNLYASLPMLFGAIQGGLFFVMIAGLGITTLMVLLGIVRHRFFRYRLDDSKIQVREGWLNKKQVSLEYQRIQNISVEHPFYFRPLKLVTLKVDSAGSSGEEVDLAALELDVGNDLREFILEKKAGALPATEAAAVTADPSLLITREPIDLFLHGVTNNRAWVIAGVLAGGLGQAGDQVEEVIAGLGIDFSTVGEYASEFSLLGGILAATAFVAFVILIMAILSIIGSFFSYYNYKLNTTGSGYLETRGLATHREVNMQKSRIQVIAIEQNWLDLIIERMHVVFEQISHETVEQPLAAGNTRIMVPSVTIDEAMMLAHDYDATIPHVHELEFSPVSFRFWTRGVACLIPLYLLAPTILSLAATGPGWIYLPFLAVLGLHTGILYLRFKRWGIAIDDDYVVLRKGLIGIDYVVLPAYKLQRLTFHESPLTRRRGLASVTFSVASRSVKIPLIDVELARKVVAYSAYQVESSNRSWM